MTERGRSLDRRDSHDEKPYCTWRAQKLATAAAPNGREEKFLDVREAPHVPGMDWTSPSNISCFASHYREKPRLRPPRHRSRQKIVRSQQRRSPWLLPSIETAFRHLRSPSTSCGLHHVRTLREPYTGRRTTAACAVHGINLPANGSRCAGVKRHPNIHHQRDAHLPVPGWGSTSSEYRGANERRDSSRALPRSRGESMRATHRCACIRREDRARFDACRGEDFPRATSPHPAAASPAIGEIRVRHGRHSPCAPIASFAAPYTFRLRRTRSRMNERDPFTTPENPRWLQKRRAERRSRARRRRPRKGR